MIGAVVLDIGNVLMGWDPHGFYDRRIGPERRARLFAEVPLEAMNLRVDLGARFGETVEAEAEAHPEWRDEILLWRDEWLGMTWEMPEFGGAAAGGAGDGDAGLRADQLRGRDAEDRRGGLSVPRRVRRAGGLGRARHLQARRRIYAAVEALGVPPERLLYADDNAANVAAAAARGLADAPL